MDASSKIKGARSDEVVSIVYNDVLCVFSLRKTLSLHMDDMRTHSTAGSNSSISSVSFFLLSFFLKRFD